MKTAWKELDKKLDRQETLSETFIRESIAARSQRSVNKFLNFELIGAAVLLVIIPFIVRQYGMPWADKIPGMKITLIAAFVLCLIGLAWQSIKIRSIFKIDMSKGVSNNIAYVKRYELYALYEKRFLIIFVPLLLLAGIIWRAVVMNDAPWYWAFLAVAVIIGTLYSVWYYKKFYSGNMAAIKRGLEELKDL